VFISTNNAKGFSVEFFKGWGKQQS
jgi:hypothetical protein